LCTTGSRRMIRTTSLSSGTGRQDLGLVHKLAKKEKRRVVPSDCASHRWR
jgi:hypothetical protein